MLKKFGILRFVLFVVVIFLGSNFCFGQGLGSSSGLFGSSKKTTESTSKPKTTTTKTTASKTTANKTSVTKPKTVSAKSQKTSPTSTRATQTTSRRSTVSKKTQKTTNVIKQNTNPVQTTTVITVGSSTTTTEVYNENLETTLEEGNLARDTRDYVRAESAYRRAQLLKADDSRAVYGLGNVYSDQQRWDEAERFYRQALQIEADNADAYIALSYVLAQPILVENLADRYAEAEKMARTAIQFDSQNPFAYDQLGVALELRGVISQETEMAYRKAIQIDPNFALAYAHLGRLLRRNGRVNESSEAYRQAIQLSNDVPTMIQVAEVMQSQQRYSESEQLLRRALKTDAKNPTALFLLGRALTTKGSAESYVEAEQVLKKGLEVSPNNFVAYTLLGSLYTRQNIFIEAEKSLLKALQIASASEKKRLAQEFETVADGLMRAGNNADAVRLYKQALLLDSKKVSLSEKLAKAQRN